MKLSLEYVSLGIKKFIDQLGGCFKTQKLQMHGLPAHMGLAYPNMKVSPVILILSERHIERKLFLKLLLGREKVDIDSMSFDVLDSDTNAALSFLQSS